MFSVVDALKAEYKKEAAKTRAALAAVRTEKFEFRPHAKSYTLGALATHLAENPSWGAGILTSSEFAMDSSMQATLATSTEELLATFDRNAEGFLKALAATDEATLQGNWKMTVDGVPFINDTRYNCLRDWVYNHMIHHRGQLTVYLRELNIPVPEIYGPTADSAMPASA